MSISDDAIVYYEAAQDAVAMVALTDKPEKVTEAIEGVGGNAIVTKLSRTGVRIV